MICRLVLSLRKASDPNLVRAWNVDHFTTQINTQNIPSSSSDAGGVGLSPMRFRGVAIPFANSEGTENGMMDTTLGGSLADSGWTIDGTLREDVESSRRES